MLYGKDKSMKKILLLTILLLLTGCSVKYNITINEDLSIEEVASLTGTSDFFANYYKTTKKKVIKDSLDIYQDLLKENGYAYELVEDDIPYAKVNKKYSSIIDYTKNSLLFNGYFDEVKYTEDGKYKKIETVGFHENNSDDPNRFYVRDLEISITCPYKVVNHNAERVNTSTNTYYFNLSNEGDNKILLEFNTARKFNPSEQAIIAIIICILVIIATWTTIYILNKKKNK